jgi:hypothetical protein
MTTLPLLSPNPNRTDASFAAAAAAATDQTTILYCSKETAKPATVSASPFKAAEFTPTRPPRNKLGPKDGGCGALFGFSPLTPSLSRRRAQLAALTVAGSEDLLEFAPQFVSTKEESDLASLLADVQPLLLHSPGRAVPDTKGGGDGDFIPMGTPKKLDSLASHLCLELTSPAKKLPLHSDTVLDEQLGFDSDPTIVPLSPLTVTRDRESTGHVKQHCDEEIKAAAAQVRLKPLGLGSLDDQLTAYFSPTTAKRRSKPRLDPAAVSAELIEAAIRASARKEKKTQKRRRRNEAAPDSETPTNHEPGSGNDLNQGGSKPARSKELACLNDLLSSYFSPKSGASRRRETGKSSPSVETAGHSRKERRKSVKQKLRPESDSGAVMGNSDKGQVTSSSCSVVGDVPQQPVAAESSGEAWARVKPVPDSSSSERAASPDHRRRTVSTDDNGALGEDTPSRRTHRRAKAAAISYADIDDFDSAEDDDDDDNADHEHQTAVIVVPTTPLRQEGTVSSAPRRRQFHHTAAASPARRRGTVPSTTAAANLSPSVKQHFRERKKRGSGAVRNGNKCCIKVQNQSLEILDLGRRSGEAAYANPIHYQQKDKDKNPIEEESSGEGAVDDGLSPAASGKYFSVVERIESPAGTFKLKLNRIVKRRQAVAESGGGGTAALVVPRFSRSKTKDLGISPQELVQFMAAASPPKVREGLSLLVYETVLEIRIRKNHSLSFGRIRI